MIDGFTTWQKIRLWLSDYKFMEKPLAQVERFFDDYIIYLRYIFALFILTVMFILLRLVLKWVLGWRHATFFRSTSSGIELEFWERFQMEDEKRSLKELKEIFEEERRLAQKKNKNALGSEHMPYGSALLQQIITAVNQGLADAEIVKILPANILLRQEAENFSGMFRFSRRITSVLWKSIGRPTVGALCGAWKKAGAPPVSSPATL